MKLGAPALVTIALEKTLNHLLQQTRRDSNYDHSLAGKVIAIQLSEAPWPLYIGFYQQVSVMGQYEHSPDVMVQLSIKDLSQLHQANVLTELIKQDKILLEGDLPTLQAFGALINNLDIDWFDNLSPYLSDNILGLLEQGALTLQSKLSQLHQDTVEHTTDLLQEEYQLLPRNAELSLFKQQLLELEQQTQHIEQLFKSLKS
ncbi:SCP2 domain-containing protein [Paraferrimonas sp. SM1919]|uniref:ubiquinone biosynthesis accessory factor UbiJ n=1 Tax=Paraferrimonas sp. SM1919 TaxID=2662263 RepID=UPI0013D257F8|nr:SCP2 sterol-binding domain-containing protein [Paraferrimonas sp. SM1919]